MNKCNHQDDPCISCFPPSVAAIKTAVSIYAYANSIGYPWRYGEGRTSVDGRIWMARFQKSNTPDDQDCAFVGYDNEVGKFVVEHSEVAVAR